MKITIYELLGMIKDGKAPERILYDNYIWSWTGDDYQTILKNEKEQFLITGMYYTWVTEFLNDEVEILDDEGEDEEKGLPEKINDWISTVGRVDDSNIEGYVHILFEQQTQLYCKINSIIDYLEKQRKGE